jgi:hypothetical protein
MNRREALIAAAILPVLASTPSKACSVALKGPRRSGLENSQIAKLFDAWWDRDADAFRAFFTRTLKDDGTLVDAALAKEMLARDLIPPQAFQVFDRFFTNTNTLKQITLFVNTDAGIIVGCSERDPRAFGRGDCSDLPELHLFHVRMSGLNPRLITHISSSKTPEVDKFSIWTEGQMRL